MAADHAVFEAFRLAGAHAVRTPGNIDHGLGKRLVQRHGRISEATDAALVPQRLLQRLTEHDGDVFDGMVRVDVGVTRGLDGQVNQRMLAERRHHMVVERHRRVDVSFAGAVEIQAQFDLGFAGFTNDGCGTRHVATPFGKCSVLLCWFSPVCAQSCSTIRNTSTKASRKRAISSSVPMHTRIQPSGPTVRMSTPRLSSSSKMRSRSSK